MLNKNKSVLDIRYLVTGCCGSPFVLLKVKERTTSGKFASFPGLIDGDAVMYLDDAIGKQLRPSFDAKFQL